MSQEQLSETNADALISLYRPLIFFVLETTGTDSQYDRIEMRMAAMRVKTHYNCPKACMRWLQSKELLASPENLEALQEAITGEKDVYPFSVSRKAKELSIIFHHSHKPALLLCSEDENLTTLLILQHSLSKTNPSVSVKDLAVTEIINKTPAKLVGYHSRRFFSGHNAQAKPPACLHAELFLRHLAIPSYTPPPWLLHTFVTLTSLESMKRIMLSCQKRVTY